MFREILYTQWRWSILPIVLCTVAAFGIPLWAVQWSGLAAPLEGDVVRMLEQVRNAGVLFPLLAAIAGTAVGAMAWLPDGRGGHVYALSLPVPRWYYALLRFAAGLVLLAPVVLAVGIGATAATLSATIPEGLYAHPGSITLRFALSVLVIYAAVFATAAASRRTQTALGVALIGLVGLQIGLSALDVNLNPVLVLGYVFNWPGPLHVFGGPWMLIDL
jgi:hypothetical protein